MKNYRLAFLIVGLLTISGYAQNIQDAYKFANPQLKGTARYNAMAGAFGALGGDISALNDNPAGSSVFLNNFGSISLSLNSYENSISLNNYGSEVSDSFTEIPQIGAVFVFNNYNENATITKFAFGATYDNNRSLYNSYGWQGFTSSSISDYFADLATGVPVSLIEPLALDNTYQSLGQLGAPTGNISNTDLQTVYLAYQAFLMDPLNVENNTYISNVSGNNFQQQYNYISEGLSGKVSANGSLTIKNKLNLGLNLNGHFINEEKNTSFFEQSNDANTYIDEIYFENRILTLGGGFSFDVGAIYRLNDNVRLGASYKSPIWFSIHDETTQIIDSNSPQDGYIYLEPNVVNILPDYKYRTPSTYNASFAYIFGRRGLLSIDYAYKDYTQTQYSAEGDYYDFTALNEQIENNFQASSTLKIGGEYRYKNWSLRGGYKYEQSPYKNEIVISDSNLYSGGVGYDFGNLKLDLSYSRFNQTYQQSFYRTGLNPADFEYVDNTFTATLSANL